MDISPEALSTQDTVHISKVSQEERMKGSWIWKDLKQQCRGLARQRSMRVWLGITGGQRTYGIYGKRERKGGKHLDFYPYEN